MARDNLTRGFLITASALLIALVATHGLAAQDRDGRWSPWVGCWEPVAENTAPSLLCVRPAEGGVDVSEIAEGAVRSAQNLQADGESYDIVAEGCEGTRTAEFSMDGKRIFTRTRQACDGDVLRTSTGLMAMLSANQWIDVQAQEDEGQSFSWVRVYRRASIGQAREAGFGDLHGDAGLGERRARSRAAAAVDVDDVAEAIRVVDAEAVRSWIAELDDPFELDGRSLIRLAESGVPSSVIDVMVAVSYPDRFAVRRDGGVEKVAAVDDGPWRGGRGYPVPVYIDPYPGYYGNPGYYGRGYGRGGYYGGGVVVVAPRSDPSPDARVIKGKGYSRGPSRGSAPTGSSVRGSGGRQEQPSTGGSSAPAQGRKAKPRGN